ncbi:serine--tRNA ligase [Candidatus Tremblaya phenacola]|uniref:serine--tRNA ligase n=1 Tax=Candidatus Tremblayella phenacoccinincola TaxID=1010676 RepID=UPI001330521F|nr:serine--tRNA ligase [Candidatus Tremblaya phenacola]KAH0998175.1 Seryl-tRNA synthetase [Candidatus Tremblaya phenacola]
MLNPTLFRNKLNLTTNKLIRRKHLLNIKTISEQEERRKALQTETYYLQTIKNIRSKTIGYSKPKGKDVSLALKEVNDIEVSIKAVSCVLNNIKESIYSYSLLIPNVPVYNIQQEDTEPVCWSEPTKYRFNIRNHIELGRLNKTIDFPSAARISGSNFVVISGNLASIYRILAQHMITIHTVSHAYKEQYLPYLVNYESMLGSGQLPKFSKDIFHINEPNKLLIPTGEVPLINLIRDRIIDEEVLPLKLVANTPCFRYEVGSYGKASQGLLRLHQFDKVELMQAVNPGVSMQALEEIAFHAEKILQLLNLPYRKLLLSGKNLSFSASKSYDLETWLPSQAIYKEVSSCSNTTGFQSRRILARYRNKLDKKIYLLHLLNGSGLAVGRTLVAILETYQTKDGRIKTPELLRNQMDNIDYV